MDTHFPSILPHTLSSVCVFVCACARARRARACVSVCLHCISEIVKLLKLTLFVYNFHTWLTAMFCLFVNKMYQWNVTKRNSYAHLMSLANKYPRLFASLENACVPTLCGRWAL